MLQYRMAPVIKERTVTEKDEFDEEHAELYKCTTCNYKETDFNLDEEGACPNCGAPLEDFRRVCDEYLSRDELEF